MKRWLPLIALCLASCAPVTDDIAAPDGYDLKLSRTFQSSDGQWAWKWRTLDGGLENFREDQTSAQGLYLLSHVTGTNPSGAHVSYMCAVFLSSPPQPGPCEAEHDVDTFAPVQVTDVTIDKTTSGEQIVKAEISVVATSWIDIAPRVIGNAIHERSS